MANSKTFRLFLSSTFNDMRAERDKLQAEIFPKLRRYCEERGFSFQPIDLRWGVSSEAGYDQKTMQICIDEVDRCKQALNPHFAIMLGERYGWNPLPAQVEADEFEQVKAAVEKRYSNDATTLEYLHRWYQKDDNAIPPQYRLQARLEKEHQDWDYWGDVEDKLRTAFRTVVTEELNNTLSEAQQFKYLKSATEQEIIEGLFNNEAVAKNNIYFYDRNFINIDEITAKEHHVEALTATDFTNLEAKDKAYRAKIEAHNQNHPDDKQPAYEITVKHFSDFENGNGDQLDPEIRPYHHQLIDKIKADLPESNVKTYDITLNPALERTQDSVTEAYLNQFAQDFYDTIFASMEQEIHSYQGIEPQQRELNDQHNYLTEKTRIFVGRKPFLQQIADYLKQEATHAPLVIYADSGSGKSSLMAKVIQNAIQDHPNATIAYRFVGTSERSNTPIALYSSLYQQLITHETLQTLQEAYLSNNELELGNIKGDLKELSKLIAHWLQHYDNAAELLILFIDALDQFLLKDPLDWLPRTLSDQIKIVISTLPESYQGIDYLPRLKQKYPKQADHFLYLEKFDATEANQLIEHYLADRQRRVTATQQQTILNAFNQSGSPLYLKILLEEASEWHSYTDVSQENYPPELDALITRLFTRLHSHSHHSLPLIHYAFAYIAASKDGIPEPELFDILTQEKNIMDDVSNQFYPRPERVPTAVWARLYAQMSHYLSIKESNGTDQISFFHRKFNEGAFRLNLNLQTDNGKITTDSTKVTTKAEIHTKLAEFYQMVYRQDAAELKKKNIQTSLGSALTELPYQLIMSGQKEAALELLTDFEFLMQKFKLNRTQEVIDDYALAKIEQANQSDNEELNERFYIFDNFISANKSILERGDKEWNSAKIFFQLSIEHADNSPLTQAAEQFEREGKVGFDYIYNTYRDDSVYLDPAIKVIDASYMDPKEGLLPIVGLLVLTNGDIVSLSNGNQGAWSRKIIIQVWDKKTFENKMLIIKGKSFCNHGKNETVVLDSGEEISYSDFLSKKNYEFFTECGFLIGDKRVSVNSYFIYIKHKNSGQLIAKIRHPDKRPGMTTSITPIDNTRFAISPVGSSFIKIYDVHSNFNYCIETDNTDNDAVFGKHSVVLSDGNVLTYDSIDDLSTMGIWNKNNLSYQDDAEIDNESLKKLIKEKNSKKANDYLYNVGDRESKLYNYSFSRGELVVTSKLDDSVIKYISDSKFLPIERLGNAFLIKDMFLNMKILKIVRASNLKQNLDYVFECLEYKVNKDNNYLIDNLSEIYNSERTFDFLSFFSEVFESELCEIDSLKFLLYESEKFAKTYDEYQLLADFLIENNILFNLESWAIELYKKSEEKICETDETLDLAYSIGNVLGNDEWAINLYHKAVNESESFEEIMSVADAVADFEKVNKNWAKDIYRKAQTISVSFNEYKRLCENVSHEAYLGDKEYGKELFVLAIKRASNIKDFSDLIEILVNEDNLNDIEYAKSLAYETLGKCCDFSDVLSVVHATSFNSDFYQEMVIQAIKKMKNDNEKNQLLEEVEYNFNEDESFFMDIKNLDIDELRLKYINT